MPVYLHLDRLLRARKMTARQLSAATGITEANLSLLRQGKVKGIRFETLAALCVSLDCQPGDLLEFQTEVDARQDLRG
ncbi:helix-turn-helix transcriptional regulator [Pannonibacter sp. P2PFMT1]|uniref:helix-turn-helix domain-containing protein n=1 Tax=Pannonibacter sp. P2PFMT1 TaxID=2003582 RepID=UPI00164978CA|nr:helix-turn-helix transcriptional regulator [Pannonibacter sp. P2PFMT1]